jgi:hypothetical protein
MPAMEQEDLNPLIPSPLEVILLVGLFGLAILLFIGLAVFIVRRRTPDREAAHPSDEASNEHA